MVIQTKKQNTSLSDATRDIGGNIGLGILQDGNKKGNITSKVALAQVAERTNSELILDDPLILVLVNTTKKRLLAN